MWTEQKMRHWLADGHLSLPPLVFKLMEPVDKLNKSEGFNLSLQVSWKNKTLLLGDS
jgi:hypothetical protein